MDKHSLSERDICTKFITPSLVSAGWDLDTQIREEVSFIKGRIIVRSKLVSRGQGKRADYIPLPPLPEQHRIVAKVDKLMALCDRLEAKLVTAAEARRRLLDALLHEALVPEGAREMEAAE